MFLQEAEAIMPGSQDLVDYLTNDILPQIDDKIHTWFTECQTVYAPRDTYSDTFVTAFGESDFNTFCLDSVTGKLEWYNWEACSQSCGSGYHLKVASACQPPGAKCGSLQVQRKSCNTDPCLCGNNKIEVDGGCYTLEAFKENMEQFKYDFDDSQQKTDQHLSSLDSRQTKTESTVNSLQTDLGGFNDAPVGTIVSWIPKPNKGASATETLNPANGWIKCDGGPEICTAGIFKGQKCEDLTGRFLAGHTNSHPYLTKHDAEMFDHSHPFTYKRYMSGGSHDCGTGGTNCHTNWITWDDNYSMSTGNVAGISASQGKASSNHWPKHMRVYYLFKCF